MSKTLSETRTNRTTVIRSHGVTYDIAVFQTTISISSECHYEFTTTNKHSFASNLHRKYNAHGPMCIKLVPFSWHPEIRDETSTEPPQSTATLGRRIISLDSFSFVGSTSGESWAVGSKKVTVGMNSYRLVRATARNYAAPRAVLSFHTPRYK